MTSLVKIKKDRVELLKALLDIVGKQIEMEDTDRREKRRLKVFCKEINKWVKELTEK